MTAKPMRPMSPLSRVYAHEYKYYMVQQDLHRGGHDLRGIEIVEDEGLVLSGGGWD